MLALLLLVLVACTCNLVECNTVVDSHRSLLWCRAGATDDIAAPVGVTDATVVAPKAVKKTKSKKSNKKHSKKQKIKVAVKPLDESEKQAIISRQSRIDMVLQVLSSVFYMLGSHLIFKLDFENRIIRRNSRFIFVCYILLSQLLYKYMLSRIESLDDQTEISGGGLPSMSNALKMLGIGDKLGGIAAAAGAGDQQEANKITVKEFDIAELKKLSNGLIFEILSVTYMHMITKVGKPLLFVPLMGMMNKFKSPIVQVHLFRFHAIGSLERPFKSQVEKMMNGMASKASEASASTADSESVSADESPVVADTIEEVEQ